MILLIDYDPDQVVHQDTGRIILKLNFFSAFSKAAYLAVFHGYTREDFERAKKAVKRKYLFVGQSGGVSLQDIR